HRRDVRALHRYHAEPHGRARDDPDRPARAAERAVRPGHGPPRMSRAQAWRRAIAPATIAIACALPFLLSNFRLFQFTQVGIYAISLLCLNILSDYNSQICIGHAAF